MGKRGAPVSRSKKKRLPILEPIATAGIARPSRRIVKSAGCDDAS